MFSVTLSGLYSISANLLSSFRWKVSPFYMIILNESQFCGLIVAFAVFWIDHFIFYENQRRLWWVWLIKQRSTELFCSACTQNNEPQININYFSYWKLYLCSYVLLQKKFQQLVRLRIYDKVVRKCIMLIAASVL